MSTTITIRTNPDIKAIAQQRAKQLGISLSDVINNALRRFTEGEAVVYDDNYSNKYISELVAARKEAIADYKAGKLPIFDNVEDLLKSMNDAADK